MRYCLLALAISFPAFADDATEPPLVFNVTVGDQTFSLGENDETKVSGTFDNAKLSLTIRPYREFSKGGVSFRYPREYVFEADVADQSFKSWTVEGSNTVLMLFTIEGEFNAAEYVEGLIPQFGRDNAKVTNPKATIKLGNQTLSGLLVTIDIGGQLISQEAYELPAAGNRGRLLVIQDSLTDTRQHSDEYTATLKQMSESFGIE